MTISLDWPWKCQPLFTQTLSFPHCNAIYREYQATFFEVLSNRRNCFITMREKAIVTNKYVINFGHLVQYSSLKKAHRYRKVVRDFWHRFACRRKCERMTNPKAMSNHTRDSNWICWCANVKQIIWLSDSTIFIKWDCWQTSHTFQFICIAHFMCYFWAQLKCTQIEVLFSNIRTQFYFCR